ncbi:hypothetical protein LTR37_008978 [Vermiconidia calcicola]|uniref:Uncharacterized protein n=1 Tax=Vermiconidia calcicola TaxID=1690605 RepID=A0ACC3N9I3_9PEZI|nr:hypothetical protein LTR37_008978 [Vermiconidia calcicola]
MARYEDWRDFVAYDFISIVLFYPLLAAGLALATRHYRCLAWRKRHPPGRRARGATKRPTPLSWADKHLPWLLLPSYFVYLAFVTYVFLPTFALTQHCPRSVYLLKNITSDKLENPSLPAPAPLALAHFVDPTISHIISNSVISRLHHSNCMDILEPFLDCDALEAPHGPQLPKIDLPELEKLQMEHSIIDAGRSLYMRQEAIEVLSRRIVPDIVDKHAQQPADNEEKQAQQRSSWRTFLPLWWPPPTSSSNGIATNVENILIFINGTDQNVRRFQSLTSATKSELHGAAADVSAGRKELVQDVRRLARTSSLRSIDDQLFLSTIARLVPHYGKYVDSVRYAEELVPAEVRRLQGLYLGYTIYEALLVGCLAAIPSREERLQEVAVAIAAVHRAAKRTVKAAGESDEKLETEARRLIDKIDMYHIAVDRTWGAGQASWVAVRDANFEAAVRRSVREALGFDSSQSSFAMKQTELPETWRQLFRRKQQDAICLWGFLKEQEVECCPVWRAWQGDGAREFVKKMPEPWMKRAERGWLVDEGKS